MKNSIKFGAIGAVALAGAAFGILTAGGSGLDTWKSGKNHNRIIQVQTKAACRPPARKCGLRIIPTRPFNSLPRAASPSWSTRGAMIRPECGGCGTARNFRKPKWTSACQPTRI